MSEPGVEPTIIEINGLTKTYQVGRMYGARTAGVISRYGKSEFVAIIGAFRLRQVDPVPLLGGLTPATSGTVRIKRRDLAGMTDSERTDLL